MELFQKKKTVNTRLESKLIVAKCRKSLICLENTSHNIFQKKLENVSTFVGIGYVSMSVNKRVHITEKTDFNDEINIFLIYISAIIILF